MVGDSFPNTATHGREPIYGVYFFMHHNVWFVDISRAPALWRHHRDVKTQNMFTLIFQDGKTEFECDEKFINLNRKVQRFLAGNNFFIIRNINLLIKLAVSPKLHIYSNIGKIEINFVNAWMISRRMANSRMIHHTRAPLNQHELILTPAWISNHIPSKVCGMIRLFIYLIDK